MMGKSVINFGFIKVNKEGHIIERCNQEGKLPICLEDKIEKAPQELLWHEKEKIEQRKMLEIVIALRNYVRRDICGM